MYLINLNQGIIKIFDNNNKIEFMPNSFLYENSCYFCYYVNIDCNEVFFYNVFSNIHKYKEIKLDKKSNKYYFNFLDNNHFQNILEELDYKEHNQFFNIYFKYKI